MKTIYKNIFGGVGLVGGLYSLIQGFFNFFQGYRNIDLSFNYLNLGFKADISTNGTLTSLSELYINGLNRIMGGFGWVCFGFILIIAGILFLKISK